MAISQLMYTDIICTLYISTFLTSLKSTNIYKTYCKFRISIEIFSTVHHKTFLLFIIINCIVIWSVFYFLYIFLYGHKNISKIYQHLPAEKTVSKQYKTVSKQRKVVINKQINHKCYRHITVIEAFAIISYSVIENTLWNVKIIIIEAIN